MLKADHGDIDMLVEGPRHDRTTSYVLEALGAKAYKDEGPMLNFGMGQGLRGRRRVWVEFLGAWHTVLISDCQPIFGCIFGSSSLLENGNRAWWCAFLQPPTFRRLYLFISSIIFTLNLSYNHHYDYTMASSSTSSFGKTNVASSAMQTDTAAQKAVQAIWQDAYCLSWEDSFEAEILRATHLLHDELRPLLQLGATVEACEKIERCADAIMGILAAWTVRSQLISRRTQFIDLKSPEPEAKALTFEFELQSLPTASGCEANIATAQKTEQYIANQIAAPFSTAVFNNNAAFDLDAAQRIRTCLSGLRKRSADVASSAKQACHDAAGVRQSLLGFLVEITAEKEEQEVLERQLKKTAAKQAKRERVLGPLKGLLSKQRPEELKGIERVTQANTQRLDLLRQYVLGISEAGTQPGLAALPPVSLAELQQQQQGVCARFGPVQQQGKRKMQEADPPLSRHDSVSGILQRTRASIAEMNKPSTSAAGPG
ncbi:hypothetical protein BC567DRAFT_208202 [Phyllosticta citribraziliensis]